MASKNNYYSPIIKWQQYEQKALSSLDVEIKPFIFPCFEIRDSKQHQTLVETFESVWNAPAMVDYSNPDGILTADRKKELKEFIALSHHKRYPIAAVLNPMDLGSTQDSSLMTSITNLTDVAFRLRIPDHSITDQHIAACQALKNLFPDRNRHIIFDFRLSPENIDSINFSQLGEKIDQIVYLGFKAAYFTSGAFPESIASVKNGPRDFSRNDLKFWKKFKSENHDLHMIYGDYGILSPHWTEETLKRRGGAVAIRYTCQESWFILRGTNTKKSESRALSDLLVNVYSDRFKGADFSWGDKLIADRADPALSDKDIKAGHYHFAEAWNHHITLVVKED